MLNNVKRKIKVLIVDDSAVVRNTLVEILQSDSRLEVIGTASDPIIAAAKIRKVIPDVITLDVEMPRMDGLTFLRKIMSQHPIPVVIISSLTAKGTETAFKALEYGAIEIFTKPQLNTKQYLKESKIRICDVVLAASKASLKRKSLSTITVEKKLSADAVITQTKSRSMIRTTDQVIAVGASTGGTEALKTLLEKTPADSPGILIVQHMPEQFTKAFANRLNSICKVTVKEATNGDTVIRGQALIAPGNKHMLLKRSGARYYVEVIDGPLVNRHRPAVDVLFRSVAQFAGPNAIGVIMTGMGADGANGMLEMKEAGAYNIAQDEKSCVVFGMPNEAIKIKAVDKITPLDQIASQIIQHTR